jgi:hypothetical protein
MKKNLKKLKLSKETVRQLNGPRMRWAVGAGVTDAGFGDCTNNTTQTSDNCPSGFCGSLTCGYCGGETSNGPFACICDSAKPC